jgi:hypothetical protein
MALTWFYVRRRRWFRVAAAVAIVGMLAGIVSVLAIPLIAGPYD